MQARNTSDFHADCSTLLYDADYYVESSGISKNEAKI